MSGRAKVLAGVLAVVLLVTAAIVLWRPGGSPEADPPGGDDMGGMEGTQEAGGADHAQMPGMGGGDASVRLTPGDISTFGITFGNAEVRRLSKTIRAVGMVEFDETRITHVAPKFGGWAERLHVDFTGRSVRAGEPLLDVYAPELVTAQEELLLAARMMDDLSPSPVEDASAGARDLLDAARRRLEYWDITREQIEGILETGEVRRTLTLHAPATGVVVEKNIVEGQAFQAGTNLYRIAGLSEVWVNAEIFEADAGLVREGTPAEVTVAAIPGRTFEGRVGYVYPTLEERTRSMRARVALPNPQGILKPGMYATVRISSDVGETLTVPASAVLYTGERAVTFVDMGGGRLMPHELRLGVRGDELVEVLSGLEPGARVVTSAQFLLDSESNLAEVMRAMMTQMDPSGLEEMDMPGMDTGGGPETDRERRGPGGDPGMDMERPDSPRPDSSSVR